MQHPGAAQTSPTGHPGTRRARARDWFSPQANVTGRGIVASYSARFWGIVVVLGVITGLGGVALVGLLQLVEHLAYGYRSGPFLDGVAAAASWRRVAALLVAAVVVSVGVYSWGASRCQAAPRCPRRCGCAERTWPWYQRRPRGDLDRHRRARRLARA